VCSAFLEERKQQQQQKKKENKTHENNKRNISRAFAIFSFLAARQMRMWKNICVYIACLLYIAFSISVLPVLCFFSVRERESQDTSVSFFVSKCTVRLCLVLSVVLMG
jgi:hypothetical protein